MIKCKFVRLSDAAKAPTKAHADDSGFDLYATHPFIVGPGAYVLVKTGIAIELPPGFGAVVRPRSSQTNRGISVCGGNGTVDPGFRGDIGVGIRNLGSEPYVVETGDRIAQLVIELVLPVEMIEAEELGATERSSNGFGSSGR